MNYDSNKQPRICEIIGVKVGEVFRIKGYNGEYHINSDGILKWGGQTSDGAIYDIINHPEHLIRRPKLTDKEIEALKAIKLIIPKAEYVEKIGSSDIVGVGNKQDGWLMDIDNSLFPSLEPGTSINIGFALQS